MIISIIALMKKFVDIFFILISKVNAQLWHFVAFIDLFFIEFHFLIIVNILEYFIFIIQLFIFLL
jgi:hypothetical protein